ncbi:hypothetical protein EA472_09530 [Natrarchaeobius oligotrophus]|uniref:Uncharacterized protein n=1 Tax=Natrarchaeobius chitinivorans TaxID=1679083 RepID=A0A3N6MDL0_NATCH|nr:hypothetical protein EA472_09530 [Natrarchaeobius chitinivorans]
MLRQLVRPTSVSDRIRRGLRSIRFGSRVVRSESRSIRSSVAREGGSSVVRDVYIPSERA